MGISASRHRRQKTRARAKSLSLPAIVEDLPSNRSLPPHYYIHRLIENFRKSTSPESMHPMSFNPDETLCEYVSASFHLPGAYEEFFPCPHCTYKEEEGHASFVEVFHFPNVHQPSVCATLTFVMPSEAVTGLSTTTGCCIELEFTKSCPNAPIAVDYSPRVALLTDTDIGIEVLRCLPRSELEKMVLVSRRWSKLIRRAERSLQQRRSLCVNITFYGESPGMLSVHFYRTVVAEHYRVLRVLTTRGLSHALKALRLHLRNAFVESVLPLFLNSVPPPSPPRNMLVNIPLPVRVDWLKTLLSSMPHNSEIGQWTVEDVAIGFENVLTLARCALEPHMKLGGVQELDLGLANSQIQLASLLNQPAIRGFAEITLWTTTEAIDTSELRTILSSWQLLKLHVVVSCNADSQDDLLTLPTQIIRDFVTLRDVSRFVAEFSLHFKELDNVPFSEMPDVDEATDRRKRFRYHLEGEDTVVRASVYKNRVARKNLTVVTFDDFGRNVLFLNGNVSLAELKQVLQRPFEMY